MNFSQPFNIIVGNHPPDSRRMAGIQWLAVENARLCPKMLFVCLRSGKEALFTAPKFYRINLFGTQFLVFDSGFVLPTFNSARLNIYNRIAINFWQLLLRIISYGVFGNTKLKVLAENGPPTVVSSVLSKFHLTNQIISRISDLSELHFSDLIVKMEKESFRYVEKISIPSSKMTSSIPSEFRNKIRLCDQGINSKYLDSIDKNFIADRASKKVLVLAGSFFDYTIIHDLALINPQLFFFVFNESRNSRKSSNIHFLNKMEIKDIFTKYGPFHHSVVAYSNAPDYLLDTSNKLLILNRLGLETILFFNGEKIKFESKCAFDWSKCLSMILEEG